jgi:hypothetical protein
MDLQLLLLELAAAVMPAAVDPVWHGHDIMPTNYGRGFSASGLSFAGAADSDYTNPGMHHGEACSCPAPTPFMGSWKARQAPRDCGRTVFTWLRRRASSWPRRRHIGDARTLFARIQTSEQSASSAEDPLSAAAAYAHAYAATLPSHPTRDERNVPVANHHWCICLLDQLEVWEVQRLARSGGRGPSVAFAYPQGAAGPLHWGLRRYWMRCLLPQPPPCPADSQLLARCVAHLQLQSNAVAPLSQAELAFRMRQFERCLRLPAVPHPRPATRPHFQETSAPHNFIQIVPPPDLNKKDKCVAF